MEQKNHQAAAKEALAEAKSKLKDAVEAVKEATSELMSAVKQGQISDTVKEKMNCGVATAASVVSTAAMKLAEMADKVAVNAKNGECGCGCECTCGRGCKCGCCCSKESSQAETGESENCDSETCDSGK